jgi:hypothetical protein
MKRCHDRGHPHGAPPSSVSASVSCGLSAGFSASYSARPLAGLSVRLRGLLGQPAGVNRLAASSRAAGARAGRRVGRGGRPPANQLRAAAVAPKRVST